MLYSSIYLLPCHRNLSYVVYLFYFGLFGFASEYARAILFTYLGIGVNIEKILQIFDYMKERMSKGKLRIMEIK